MNVGELIEQLKDYNPKRLVVMSRDPEGNGYGPLAAIATAAFANREIGEEKLTEEMIKRGYTEEDVMEDGEPALVFWPAY